MKWKFSTSQQGIANGVSSLGGFAKLRFQLLPPQRLGKAGLSGGSSSDFWQLSQHLGISRFPILICLHFTAWEKKRLRCKTCLGGELKCLPALKFFKKKQNPKQARSQPTKVLREDFTEQKSGCFCPSPRLCRDLPAAFG